MGRSTDLAATIGDGILTFRRFADRNVRFVVGRNVSMAANHNFAVWLGGMLVVIVNHNSCVLMLRCYVA